MESVCLCEREVKGDEGRGAKGRSDRIESSRFGVVD